MNQVVFEDDIFPDVFCLRGLFRMVALLSSDTYLTKNYLTTTKKLYRSRPIWTPTRRCYSLKIMICIQVYRMTWRSSSAIRFDDHCMEAIVVVTDKRGIANIEQLLLPFASVLLPHYVLRRYLLRWINIAILYTRVCSFDLEKGQCSQKLHVRSSSFLRSRFIGSIGLSVDALCSRPFSVYCPHAFRSTSRNTAKCR